jgi:hypothetical protein
VLVRAALVVLLVLLVGAVPAAHADLLGEKPETLSSPGSFGPDPVVTPRGHTLVSWREGSTIGPVYGSWRRPGGSFGRPFKIGGAQGVSLATGDDYVVLGRRDADTYVTLLRAGATKPTDQILSTSDNAEPPQLAADAKGNVVAVVQFFDGPIVAWSRPPGGSFGSPQVIALSNRTYAVPAMNAAGDAAIATQDGNGEVLVSVRPAGQVAFGPMEPTGINGIAFFAPTVAVTPNGDVAVANFARIGPGQGTQVPNFAFRPAGGIFSLTPLLLDGRPLALLTRSGSELTVADTGPNGDVLRLRDRLPNGSLTVPETVTKSPVCPVVTSTAAGNVTIAYEHPCDAPVSSWRLAVVERPLGGTPTPPVQIGPPGTSGVTLASNRIGSTAIAWLTEGSTPSRSRVQAAVRDGSAELAVENLSRALTVTGGRAQLRLACSGLRHCAGTVTVQRAGSSKAAKARTKVRVRRGRHAKKRVRVPRSALRGKRPRVKITFTLSAQKGAAKRRSVVVRIKRG